MTTTAPTTAPTKAPTKTLTLTPTKVLSPEFGIGATQIREKDGMKQVYVPAGSFMMGSNDGNADEKPVHEVFLDAYWIDKYEVSNGQYAKCVQSGACKPPDRMDYLTRRSYYWNSIYLDFPVIYVSWHHAQDYCSWVGGLLPTEAEWEKAAKGTDGRIYPWGNSTPSCSFVNYINCEGDTTKVGSYSQGASPYGALDMAGNVWEWVADWYGSYINETQNNPTGPESGKYKVLRGGSWSSNEGALRVSYRYDHFLDHSYYSIGFRCVTSP